MSKDHSEKWGPITYKPADDDKDFVDKKKRKKQNASEDTDTEGKTTST